ncbi:hypothetical protein [Streptomyces sp. NPDC058045]|uniref:hypothetical protein n=1 Tax=Streptomyces sp. NPDC058045 TaxID=3346311 RepID=UPI0036E50C7C
MSTTSRLGQLARVQLLTPVLLLASYAAQLAGVLTAHAGLLAAGTASGLIAEGILHRWQRPLLSALGKVRADATLRQVLRDFLLVTGLLMLQPGDELELPPVAGLLCYYALHLACHAAAILVRRTRTLPFVTRNIDADALRLSPAPPSLLLRRPGQRVLLFGLPATTGLLLNAATGRTDWAEAGVAVSVALAAGGLVMLLVRLLPGRRPLGEEAALRWLDSWLEHYRPTVGMYFSGGTSSAYQANMWLGPLAEMEGRPLIVLRERFMVQKIAATDIPVLCLPKVAHLMRLEHSALKVLIHPANSGKTSQILRIPTMKHAFVNHGESDKLSSCNPYAKAYDEVWVAGPAARERYALADVGVDDRDVVEIGRPQLDTIRPYAGPPAEGAPLTVVYAPTWEGWDGNPGNTSIVLAGEHLVRALLAEPGVRLLYKPHPMTGSVDPRAGAADARIQAMIRAAQSGQDHRPSSAVAAELARRTEELDRLTAAGFRSAADDAERMLRQGTPEPGRAAAVEAATVAWQDAYWASLPPTAHQIITGPRPALYSCFDVADLLVSDVSSVVSDYLASGKPYAVANTSGLPEEEFRRAFPTTAAAAVLSPEATEVPALLASVRDPRLDLLIGARAELKRRLLGPDEPPSVVRFRRAAEALRLKAVAHEERMAAREAEGLAVQSEVV